MSSNHFKPMFDFDRLYWPPFTRRRGFDEEQWVTVWSEYDGRPEPTAIPIIDSVVERLHEGRPAAGWRPSMASAAPTSRRYCAY